MQGYIDRKKLTAGLEQEQAFAAAKAADRAESCMRKHETAFTDFLDPRLGGLLFARLSTGLGLNVMLYGGFEGAERVMLGFFPEYIEPCAADFPIKAVKISRNIKFSSALSHRDYLGSIMGLGIDRSKLGDIILADGCAYCYLCADIADYICSNMTQAGRARVSATLCLSGEEACADNGAEENIIVSSERVDNVICKAFKLSRSGAQALIDGEKVNINYALAAKAHIMLKPGDLVSVRGCGRIKIIELCGRTKKDRLVIKILSYK